MELAITNALRDLGQVGRGVSGAHFISCDDGEEYVVKFKLGNMPRLFLNEWIGFCFAKLLSCPVPTMKAVRFNEEFVNGSEKLRTLNVDVGIYPGSLRLSDSLDFAVGAANFQIEPDNISSFPSIVAFDNWLVNEDRDNPGNNIIQFKNGEKRFMIIDNGHILGGPTWSVDSLNNIASRKTLQKVFMYMSNKIVGVNPFDVPLRTIETTRSDIIQEIVDATPLEWFMDKDQISLPVAGVLDMRKSLIRKILSENKEKFPNCEWR